MIMPMTMSNPVRRGGWMTTTEPVPADEPDAENATSAESCRFGIGAVGDAEARAVEDGPPTSRLTSPEREPATDPLEFSTPLFDPAPPRNTLRPGPKSTRASGAFAPALSRLWPVSAITSGHSPGISFDGGSGIGR